MRVLKKTSGKGGYIHHLSKDELFSLCGYVRTTWDEWEILDSDDDFLDMPDSIRCWHCRNILMRPPAPPTPPKIEKVKKKTPHELELEKLAAWQSCSVYQQTSTATDTSQSLFCLKGE